MDEFEDWLDAMQRRIDEHTRSIGRPVLPDHLPRSGIVERVAPDFTDDGLIELMAKMNNLPPESHSSILDAWKPGLSPVKRAGLVAALITEATDARTRLAGFRLLGMFDVDVAEPHMRQLLDTTAAGHAAVWLLERGLADGDSVGSFITPTMMVDILAQLVEHPETLCEQFLLSHDPAGMLDHFWRHPAPETAALLDALGQHLPDRTLAKLARKAAIKHRSWMTNQELA